MNSNISEITGQDTLDDGHLVCFVCCKPIESGENVEAIDHYSKVPRQLSRYYPIDIIHRSCKEKEEQQTNRIWNGVH